MTTVTVPAWAGSAETMARRVKPIIHLIVLGQAVTPTEISAIVRPEGSTKDYSAKYITFLRLLGFDFSVSKQGRKIVSYTTIKEPANVSDIRAAGPKTKKSKTVKASVAKKTAPKKSVTKIATKSEEVKTTKAPVVKKVAAAKKTVAKGGSAANLAKLKEVGARFKKVSKHVDPVEDTFGTTGELGAIDGGWDSIEGLDLSKLL